MAGKARKIKLENMNKAHPHLKHIIKVKRAHYKIVGGVALILYHYHYNFMVFAP